MEGDTLVLTVVPEHFIGVWPGETRGGRTTTSELHDTRWRLTRIGDQAVALAENQREPNLRLEGAREDVPATGPYLRTAGTRTETNTKRQTPNMASPQGDGNRFRGKGPISDRATEARQDESHWSRTPPVRAPLDRSLVSPGWSPQPASLPAQSPCRQPPLWP